MLGEATAFQAVWDGSGRVRREKGLGCLSQALVSPQSRRRVSSGVRLATSRRGHVTAIPADYPAARLICRHRAIGGYFGGVFGVAGQSVHEHRLLAEHASRQ